MMWALVTANYQIIALLLIALVIIFELVRRGSPELILDALFVCLAVTRPSFAAAGMIIAQYTIRRLPILARGCAGLIGRDLPPIILQVALPGALPRPADADHPVTSPTIFMPTQPTPSRQPTQSAPARPLAPLPAVSWMPVVQEQPDTRPHSLVLGPSGQGKSWMIEAMTRTRDGLAVIIQPNKREHDWYGISVVQCANDGSFVPIANAIEWVRGEFTRRGGAMKVGDPGDWLTVVWDEIPLCIDQLGDLAKRTIVQLISAGRPRKMRLIGGSNSTRVGAIGLDGFGDLTFSCAIINIGSFAVAKLPTLERIPWPATLEIDGRPPIAIDRSAVPQIIRMPLPSRRVIDLSALCLDTSGKIAPAQVAGAPVARPQTDADRELAKKQRIERYAGMRAMGYSREVASDKIHAEGGTFDNNEWAEAGKLLEQRMGAAAPRKAKKPPAPPISTSSTPTI
jgi:hypothetical protein